MVTNCGNRQPLGSASGQIAHAPRSVPCLCFSDSSAFVQSAHIRCICSASNRIQRLWIFFARFTRFFISPIIVGIFDFFIVVVFALVVYRLTFSIACERVGNETGPWPTTLRPGRTTAMGSGPSDWCLLFFREFLCFARVRGHHAIHLALCGYKLITGTSEFVSAQRKSTHTR